MTKIYKTALATVERQVIEASEGLISAIAFQSLTKGERDRLRKICAAVLYARAEINQVKNT